MTATDELQPEYSDDGVDLSLIRWMLSLTPAERLDFHERQVNSVLEIWEHNAVRPPWLTAVAGAQ